MHRMTGIQSRFMAWFMARAGGRYEELTGPMKRSLLGEMEGILVEIGSGTGPNLRYLSPKVRVVGVDPNPHMHRHYRMEARRLDRAPELVMGDAHALPFPDESVHGVVSTLVLCSVRDQDQAFREIRRILKPGGRFVFVEHVGAARGSWALRFQKLVKPAWRVAGEGCEPDRNTEAHLRRAGFREVHLERFRLPLPVVGPHISGTAVK